MKGYDPNQPMPKEMVEQIHEAREAFESAKKQARSEWIATEGSHKKAMLLFDREINIAEHDAITELAEKLELHRPAVAKVWRLWVPF